MAYSARIDELEKKFSENARRYFAPLANEYRKAGDLERAIEICRAHLPQQPGHMSGHIVYGQALYESRQLDEAKTVFEAALALDPENLIALRHLGDIARDGSDPATARSWYLRVLDADPRNEDVAAMLAELDEAAAAAPPAAAETSSEGAGGWGDINPERPAEEAESAVADAGATGSGTRPREAPEQALSVDPEPDQSSTIGVDEAPPAGEATDEAAASTPAPRPPDAEAPTRDREQPSLDRVLNEAFATDGPDADSADVSTAAFASPAAAEGVIAPAGNDEDNAGTSGLGDGALAEVDALFDEIAAEGTNPAGTRAVDPDARRAAAGATAGVPGEGQGREDATSDALFGDVTGEDADAGAEPVADRLDGLETSEFVAPSREADPVKRPRTTGSMAVSGLTSFEQPTDEDSSTRAAFVTETMAELYLQQGFTAEALDIYRQLLEQNPEDTSLRDRVEQLERGGQTSLSVAAVSSEVIQAAQQRHAARPVRTARSFFGRLAGQHVGQRAEPADVEPVASQSDEGALEGTGPRESTSEVVESYAGRRDETEAAPSHHLQTPEPSRPEARRTGAGIPIVSDLFGEVEVSEADEAAASMLASAFSTPFAEDDMPPQSGPGMGATSVPSAGRSAGTTGRPARAAGRELSLDQVFRDSENRPPRKSGPFSFDQFFSDGSQGASATEAPAPEEPKGGDDPASPEGDLEQFTAWLEGLKRK